MCYHYKAIIFNHLLFGTYHVHYYINDIMIYSVMSLAHVHYKYNGVKYIISKVWKRIEKHNFPDILYCKTIKLSFHSHLELTYL